MGAAKPTEEEGLFGPERKVLIRFLYSLKICSFMALSYQPLSIRVLTEYGYDVEVLMRNIDAFSHAAALCFDLMLRNSSNE